MTTNDIVGPETDRKNLDNLEKNMARVDVLTQRLVVALSKGRQVPPALQGPSQELYAKAAGAYWAEMINNPAKLIEHQLSFWSKSVTHFVEAQALLA